MTSWFLRQPAEFQQSLRNLWRVKHFEPGEPIDFEVDDPACLWGVLEGCIRVIWSSPTGESTLASTFLDDGTPNASELVTSDDLGRLGLAKQLLARSRPFSCRQASYLSHHRDYVFLK